MLNRKKDKEINYTKLNEGIKVGVRILHIMYFLIFIAAIYLGTLLVNRWHILEFIKDILGVLSPLFIGIFIAWLLNPLVTKIQNKGVNRVLSTVFVYVVIIVVITIFCKIATPQIGKQLNDITSSTPNFISFLKKSTDDVLGNLSSLTGYDTTDLKLQVYDSVNKFGSGVSDKLPTLLVKSASNIFTGGFNLIFGLIIGFYMLFDFKSIRVHFMSLIPKKYKSDTDKLIDLLNKDLKSFINGTLLIMLILFICQTIGLTLAGMRAPLVFGLFCAITNVIPYVGPYIGGIPTVLVGFSISPMTGFLCLISVLVCQTVESYFLQPVVMGKTMHLHPVTIMIGLLLFGHFFGILGMIFATPVISICRTIWNFYDEKYDIMGIIKN